jgi:hypothetical protein
MMIQYRYFLLDKGRKVSDSEEFGCRSDAEAFIIAQEILRRRPEFQSIELWHGTRCALKLDRDAL